MKLLKPSWINHDGHPIFSIDIHPDDEHLATGGQGDDNTGRVVIWNLKAVLSENSTETAIPKLFCQLDHHSACVNCVRWSNSGRFLASGGDDKVIIIWKLVTRYSGNAVTNSAFEKNNLEVWKTVSILRGHDGDVLDLAWSPKDTYLATCSIDNSIKIWDAQNFPQVVVTLLGHTSMVKGITWDPIGKYIASQSVDKTLRIWRTSDWTTEHVVKEPFVDCGGTTHVLRLGWSPDGLYLVSAHSMNFGFPTAQIIERDGWKVDKDFVGHRKAVVCVRFNNNIQENNRVKQCCVAIGSRDRSISVWSTALKRPVVVVKDAFSHSVMDITWSHCGTIMMACSWDGSVMAAQFSYTEIGKPLSQEDTDSLYQRFYGDTGLTVNKQNIVPNMEVFLARNTKTEQNKQEELSHAKPAIEPSPPQVSMPPPSSRMLDASPENTNKGPTTQIETRTADGKRRITPKFLPLPTEDNMIPTSEEPTVFTNKDGISTTTQENLRESIQNMVSNIDDVSFGESKKLAAKSDAVNCSGGSAQKEQSPPPTSTPMEIDPLPTPTTVNGFESNSKTTTADPVKNGVNGASACQAELNNVTNGDTISKPVVNGTSSVDPTTTQAASKPTPTTTLLTTSSQQQQDGDLKTAKTPLTDQIPPVNIIQVKRKRPMEDLKPPVISNKKKFTPQSLRTFPARKSDENSPTPLEQIGVQNSRVVAPTKTGCSSKSRLPPMKIEFTFALQVNIKPETAYSLEISNNYKRPDGICHQIKCQHSPSSMQGLGWTGCTDAPICAVSGDLHRIVALCEDASVHVFDIKGRYAMSPFVLSGYPSRLVQSGRLLLVITIKGILHIWDIHNKTVVIKSESLVPILNQPGGNEPGEKSVDITNIFIAAGSSPVIFLSNGKSFIFNNGMCTWSLFADAGGLVSSPMMPDAGELASSFGKTKLNGRRRKPEPAVLSHIKLQLIKALELKKASSIQQWLVVLGKTLASCGLEKELHILCEDLLGPAHSSAASGVSWAPKLGDCVDKRAMLREILNSLLDDLRWQDFFCEFDEQLRDVEGLIC